MLLLGCLPLIPRTVPSPMTMGMAERHQERICRGTGRRRRHGGARRLQDADHVLILPGRDAAPAQEHGGERERLLGRGLACRPGGRCRRRLESAGQGPVSGKSSVGEGRGKRGDRCALRVHGRWCRRRPRQRLRPRVGDVMLRNGGGRTRRPGVGGQQHEEGGGENQDGDEGQRDATASCSRRRRRAWGHRPERRCGRRGRRCPVRSRDPDGGGHRWPRCRTGPGRTDPQRLQHVVRRPEALTRIGGQRAERDVTPGRCEAVGGSQFAPSRCPLRASTMTAPTAYTSDCTVAGRPDRRSGAR